MDSGAEVDSEAAVDSEVKVDSGAQWIQKLK